jgi:ATP-dependent Lon protease
VFCQADFAASLTTSQGYELQEVLESELLETRLARTLELLKKEKELSALQQEISRDVEKRISKTNRTYFLNEQLKSIKKELGMEKDDKDALMQKFKDRVRYDGVMCCACAYLFALICGRRFRLRI